MITKTQNTDIKRRVVVGMSGGVDSSVAAWLLVKEGYDVVGLFMHNWEEEEGGVCTSATDWEDALAVSGKIGIPCYSVNFSKEYMERVFAHFIAEYKAGRTPNPDVLCNREIKFSAFADYAKNLQADYIATGHYCDIYHGEGGDTRLIKPLDTDKDQTYFLNQVSTKQLENTLFPLSGMHKTEVRKIAEREGLVTARKKDSTGICFIGERKFRAFLSEYLPAQKGEIRDTNGKIIGEHLGLMYYTLGQRKGLGIGGVKGENQARWYVVEKDLKDNILVVSCGEGEELLSDFCDTGKMNIIGAWEKVDKLKCNAKFRYRQSEQGVTVFFNADGSTKIVFDTPQRAVTPGQYACLYLENRCIGGAVIEKTGRNG